MFNSCRVQQYSFLEIDQEIFCTVIYSLPLIQKRQLSVSAKECAQVPVNDRELSLPRKSVVW